MTIMVNGERREVDAGTTIQALLEALALDGSTLVVQRNEDIIDQAQYGEVTLTEEDHVELVRFVGGG